jgi:hypothetical protein
MDLREMVRTFRQRLPILMHCALVDAKKAAEITERRQIECLILHIAVLLYRILEKVFLKQSCEYAFRLIRMMCHVSTFSSSGLLRS